MKCKPKPFYKNEGVVELTHWIEKIKSVFEISFYVEDCKVKFDASTFEGTTLSWWNRYTKTMDINIDNSISWYGLKQLLVDKYCPREEMQKLEQER